MEKVAVRRQTPTLRLRRLAAELRQLRADSGKSREEVAEESGINTVTLYRLETARARPQKRTVITLLDLYGIHGQRRDELLAVLRESGERVWLQSHQLELPDQYATYIGFEEEADNLLNYESLFMPGLLQTAEYAHAVIRGTLPTIPRQEVEKRVEARMARQALLTRQSPLRLWAVIDEAVLRREVGGRQTMRGQLHKLLEASEEPNITVQVIPYGAGAHPGMTGSFVIMKHDSDNPDVIYIESIATDLFLEGEDEIAKYTLVFEHLRAVAASPEATRHLIASVYGEST
ncbi:helix-turn-helix domain-containing protein [Sphaerimonospora cavernae]|uniref:helix-turn-helix domain-containing protein n=1 Tax=Sphaerimonospora cavernae TaxID=1740611 RepID=UPI00373FD435